MGNIVSNTYILVLSLLIMSGCSQTKCFKTVTTGSWIYTADPIMDFKKAVEKNDLRFKGVYRDSLVIPWIDDIGCLNVERDIAPIEGTSDIIKSYEQRKFNEISLIYAQYFNGLMLKHRIKNENFKCNP